MNDRYLHFNCISWIGVWAVAIVTILSISYAGESSWTLRYDFNAGTVDEKVAGLDAAGGTRYTKEQSFEGGKAVVLEARRGRENYGRWGGRVNFPSKLRKGDEVWWRVRTFWPKAMDYTAEPRLKFLRIHTCSASGKNQGYNDIYINKPGSKIPFQFIYEGGQKWSPASDVNDAIVPDTWETYEYYMKLDNRSVDEGGQARIRFWKNGKLLKDITNRKTLKIEDDYADSALLFTYWNSSPYLGQIVYEEGGPFQLKELVTCSMHPGITFRVEKTRPNVVYLIDPKRDWRKRVRPFDILKTGEVLTGQTSKNTGTITEVLHSHPLMDIKMYVDDMVLTCKTPQSRDARGNPCIGMEPKHSQAEGLPETNAKTNAEEAIFFQDNFESGTMKSTNADGFSWKRQRLGFDFGCCHRTIPREAIVTSKQRNEDHEADKKQILG